MDGIYNEIIQIKQNKTNVSIEMTRIGVEIKDKLNKLYNESMLLTKPSFVISCITIWP